MLFSFERQNSSLVFEHFSQAEKNLLKSEKRATEHFEYGKQMHLFDNSNKLKHVYITHSRTTNPGTWLFTWYKTAFHYNFFVLRFLPFKFWHSIFGACFMHLKFCHLNLLQDWNNSFSNRQFWSIFRLGLLIKDWGIPNPSNYLYC